MLVIVVATGGHITHTVIETDEPYDATTLTQAANYINAEFAGLTLDEARDGHRRAHARRAAAVRRADGARAAAGADRPRPTSQPEETLHVQGASFLIDELAGEPADRQRTLETLRVLFRMIEEKHQLVELLTRSHRSRRPHRRHRVRAPSPDLHPFSLVASTFQDGDRTGTVGVIGPTRMRYQRAISVVDGVSQAVTPPARRVNNVTMSTEDTVRQP